MSAAGSKVVIPFGQDPVDSTITVPMMSDSCDRAGLRNQVAERWLAPLVPGTSAYGRARTVRFVPDATTDPERPYDDAIDFIDGTSPGDMIIVATETQMRLLSGVSSSAQPPRVAGLRGL